MWKILVVVLSSIILAASLPSDEQPVANANEQSTISTTAASSSISTAANPTQSTTQSLEESPEPSILVTSGSTSTTPSEEDAEKEETSTSKTRITFDQRQEGHYNIRADLENFMIIVVPPNPMAGMGLLDLLAESALKRSNVKKMSKKHHLLSKMGLRKADDSRIGAFLQRAQQRQSVDPPLVRTGEYIEGRTPYSVDISSSESDVSNFNGNSQVGMVPPPPYPMQFHHLAPVDGYSSSPQGKLFEIFSRFGERRFPKAISHHSIDAKELQSNRVQSVTDGRSYNNQQVSLSNDDEEPGPPKNPTETKKYVDLVNAGSLPLADDLELNGGRYQTRSAAAILSPIDRNWELKLIGASEQCGPGRRRNSYGICQFVPDIN